MTDHAELITEARYVAATRCSDGGLPDTIIRKICDALAAVVKERDELAKQVYVPGMWQCPKCKCVVMSTNLHADTGGWSANDVPQRCPNDCGPMWRRTERQAGNDLIDAMEKLSDRAVEAERECDEALRLLEGMQCEGCPPVGYPTDDTRCLPCPRRQPKGS